MDLFDIAVAKKLSGGGGGGGGGDSDFSTAQVTISNSGSFKPCAIPFINEGQEVCMAITDIMGGDISIFVIPLYKGKAVIYIESENISVTGAVEDLGGGYLMVTGDGTITIS